MTINSQPQVEADIAQCNCVLRKCIHYMGVSEPLGREELQVHTCLAFPEGIPSDIAYGDEKHLMPYPGDEGITYKADTNYDKTVHS